MNNKIPKTAEAIANAEENISTIGLVTNLVQEYGGLSAYGAHIVLGGSI